MADADAIKRICDIYDWDGKGELDMVFFGDVIYALGLNITKKICKGLGQQEEAGKKFLKYDDVVKLVQEAVNTKNCQGKYDDIFQLCRLYDKNENGTMMLAELENILANMADEMPKEDVQALLAELCDREDEDGFFPYKSFVDRLTGKA